MGCRQGRGERLGDELTLLRLIVRLSRNSLGGNILCVSVTLRKGVVVAHTAQRPRFIVALRTVGTQYIASSARRNQLATQLLV